MTARITTKTANATAMGVTMSPASYTFRVFATGMEILCLRNLGNNLVCELCNVSEGAVSFSKLR